METKDIFVNKEKVYLPEKFIAKKSQRLQEKKRRTNYKLHIYFYRSYEQKELMLSR
jgi:hypothetical protein